MLQYACMPEWTGRSKLAGSPVVSHMVAPAPAWLTASSCPVAALARSSLPPKSTPATLMRITQSRVPATPASTAPASPAAAGPWLHVAGRLLPSPPAPPRAGWRRRRGAWDGCPTAPPSPWQLPRRQDLGRTVLSVYGWREVRHGEGMQMQAGLSLRESGDRTTAGLDHACHSGGGASRCTRLRMWTAGSS